MITRVLDMRCYWEYPVRLPLARVAYFPVPKNACTSAKHFFYKCRFNRDYKNLDFPSKAFVHVHNVFPSQQFDERRVKALRGWSKLTIVREPIGRFISTYCNRVLHHNDLAKSHQVQKQGLPINPDIDFFVDNLERYCACSRLIRHHVVPQTTFLGTDPAVFDMIYDVKSAAQLAASINEITGLDEQLPRLQEGGREFKDQATAKLSKHSLGKLRNYYSSDFDAFGAFFR